MRNKVSIRKSELIASFFILLFMGLVSYWAYVQYNSQPITNNCKNDIIALSSSQTCIEHIAEMKSSATQFPKVDDQQINNFLDLIKVSLSDNVVTKGEYNSIKKSYAKLEKENLIIFNQIKRNEDQDKQELLINKMKDELE